MCTYLTERSEASGSGKGATGWFPLTAMTVYFDHPVHALAEHTMNLDFTNPGRGASSRVALELSAATAVRLIESVAQVLAEVPTELTGVDPDRARAVRDAARHLAGVSDVG